MQPRNDIDYWSLYLPLNTIYHIQKYKPHPVYYNPKANLKRIQQAERRYEKRVGLCE